YPSQREVVAASTTYGDPLKSQEDLSKLLDWIHGSWISPFFRTRPPNEIGLFLSCLSHKKASAIGKEILYTAEDSLAEQSSPIPSLSSLGKSFLQATLIRYLTAEVDELLPIECLPESPLNLFLTLSFDEMSTFLDLFGLHDLATEIKQIIDKQ